MFNIMWSVSQTNDSLNLSCIICLSFYDKINTRIFDFDHVILIFVLLFFTSSFLFRCIWCLHSSLNMCAFNHDCTTSIYLRHWDMNYDALRGRISRPRREYLLNSMISLSLIEQRCKHVGTIKSRFLSCKLLLFWSISHPWETWREKNIPSNNYICLLIDMTHSFEQWLTCLILTQYVTRFDEREKKSCLSSIC